VVEIKDWIFVIKNVLFDRAVLFKIANVHTFEVPDVEQVDVDGILKYRLSYEI
jgi:hypothetical protein